MTTRPGSSWFRLGHRRERDSKTLVDVESQHMSPSPRDPFVQDHGLPGIRINELAGIVVEGDPEGRQSLGASPVVMSAEQEFHRPMAGSGGKQHLDDRRRGAATRSADPIEGSQKRRRPAVRLRTNWTVIHHLFEALAPSPVQHHPTSLYRALSFAGPSTVDEQRGVAPRRHLCRRTGAGCPRGNRGGLPEALRNVRRPRSTVAGRRSNRSEHTVSVVSMACPAYAGLVGTAAVRP